MFSISVVPDPSKLSEIHGNSFVALIQQDALAGPGSLGVPVPPQSSSGGKEGIKKPQNNAPVVDCDGLGFVWSFAEL